MAPKTSSPVARSKSKTWAHSLPGSLNNNPAFEDQVRIRSLSPLRPAPPVDAFDCIRYFLRVPKFLVPRQAVYRLSMYFRIVERLFKGRIDTVSSAVLAKAAGVKPSQLRKDLTYFGQFGTRGLGYKVESLKKQLARVIRTARFRPVILVGVGNLGTALIQYDGFAKEEFEIIAAFDIREELGSDGRFDIPILPNYLMKSFVAEHGVKLAILTVPGSSAQSAANELVEAGIQAILNFSTVVLQVPNNVAVNNINLAIELENLSYFMK